VIYDEPIAQTSWRVTQFNLRFPGQYYDAETGKHYNYFRDYDATIGRYLQSDPLGVDAGPNTFAYSEADPLNAFDPYGLAKRTPGGSTKCTPLVRIVLTSNVDLFCRSGMNSACLTCDECFAIDRKVLAKRGCILSQSLLSRKCYPNDQTHKKRIEDEKQGIKNCMTILAGKSCNSMWKNDDPFGGLD
jgi:RHS repeat-associated protein